MTPADALRRSVGTAADELQRLRADDPAAAAARHALRLTRHTLECFWLPALDEHDDDGVRDDHGRRGR